MVSLPRGCRSAKLGAELPSLFEGTGNRVWSLEAGQSSLHDCPSNPQKGELPFSGTGLFYPQYSGQLTRCLHGCFHNPISVCLLCLPPTQDRQE